MPPVHDHNEHHHRPEWWNGISLGNALTLLGGLIVAAVAWGGFGESQKRQDYEIAAVDQRGQKAIEQVRQDLQRIEQKLDQLILQSRRE